MFPHAFYKWLHLSGLIMMYCGLIGLWGSRLGSGPYSKKRDLGLALIHGFGMAFLLVGGFGMLARLGLVQELPIWIYLKLAIWLILGASLMLAKRRAHWGLALLGVWIVAGMLAGYFGIYKPF